MPATFIPKTVLVDTGFWFAVYDSDDQYHELANTIYGQIQNARLLIPWPTLYELLNTRFFKNPAIISGFESLLKKQNVEKLDDREYREAALEQSFYNIVTKRRISLVDSVIRQMLSDPDVPVNYFVTFNEKDFADILRKRQTIQFYYP